MVAWKRASFPLLGVSEGISKRIYKDREGEFRATAEVGGFQQLLFILKMALGLMCKYENDGCGTGMKFISLNYN